VVVVVVGQDHGRDVSRWIDSDGMQPEADFLDRGNLDLDHLREERVPPG
jgi:hypothetical protein